MNETREIDQGAFLDAVRESGLIAPAALQAALGTAPPFDRTKHLARYFVRQNLLTRFQAQQLLAGRSGGFFLGQYRVLDLLGRGGMGKVYKAEHMTMSRIVALKVLNSDLTRTERALQLFRREVKAAARLAHPNIVTAYDANEVNGRAFLVLEYVAGPSLSQLVREKGPVPVGVACEYIRQAAMGLQHAHELGMVHRDVKPSNLLVQPPAGRSQLAGGTIKLVDFGLALLGAADEDELAPDRQVVMGTPDYLSPEQARDLRSVDIRSDLYSLGCTFYYLLAGHVPFPGGSALEKITRHATEDADPIEERRPSVPPGVAAIVRRLLAKAPEQRFKTPRELADAVEFYAESQPTLWSERKTDSTANSSSDEESAADESSSGGSSAGVKSGTLSLAEFASTLSAGDRTLDARPPKRPNLFFWALIVGFAIGLVLIAMTAW